MRGMTRRALLAAGAGAAAGAVVPAVRARPRVTRRRDLEQVEHIVILMQENISFDHYFGTLSGVRGFSDPDALTLAGGRSVFQQPDPASADGYLVPWHFDTSAYNPCQVLVDNGWDSRHAAVDGGRMDGVRDRAPGHPQHLPDAVHNAPGRPGAHGAGRGFHGLRPDLPKRPRAEVPEPLL